MNTYYFRHMLVTMVLYEVKLSKLRKLSKIPISDVFRL